MEKRKQDVRRKSSSSHRSSSRQSRASKISHALTAAVVQEAVVSETPPDEIRENYKEYITGQFFEFLLNTVMIENTDDGGRKVAICSIETFPTSSEDSFTKVIAPKEVEEIKKASKDNVSQSRSDPDTLRSSSYMSSKASSSASCASECKCTHKLTFENGNVYEGHLKNGIMHGRGFFQWSDGSKYEGDFLDGFPNGRGKMVLQDLSTYEGEFSNGFFHGKGTLNIASSPILYNGSFKEGEKHGRGWLLYDSENYYNGNFSYGLKQGFGYRHYKNGTQYKGEWQNDIIDGTGDMLWNNNDYYSGSWKDGLPNGYGEYVWSVIGHKDFVFVNYNCYKGNWTSGKRNGAGIMNFGHESGAKLAGMWKDNEKHGPGLMVCGNGFTLQRNPLFENDKPATFSLEVDSLSSGTNILPSDAYLADVHSLQTFKEIAQQIESKENLNTINKASMSRITKSGCDIRKTQFVKLLEKNVGNEPPLKIPIYTHTEDVDFSFWTSIVLNPPEAISADSAISTVEVKKLSKTSSPIGLSVVNFVPSSRFTLQATKNMLDRSFSQQNLPRTNEEGKKLKHLIMNNLQELKEVYKVYATMACNEKDHAFQPLLIRLFLWQIYWDIGLTESGDVSIVDADEAFAVNPKSCIDSYHDPWEIIYFWQFLQALVSTSMLIFFSTNIDYLPVDGIMYYIFKDFLDNRLYPNVGKFKNNCLTRFKDVVPIKQVYSLYKSIGEPHTVSTFLKETCLQKNHDVPCYKYFKERPSKSNLLSGQNIVFFNNKINFEEDELSRQNIITDTNSLGLYTFGEDLGRRTVLRCLSKVCPQILQKRRYQLQYRLSFIEFYEVLLVMAFEKVEQERLQLIADLNIPTQKLEEDKISKSGPPSSMRTGITPPTKKKKPKG